MMLVLEQDSGFLGFNSPPVEEDAAPPMEEAEDAAVQGANVPAPASNANQGA